MDFISQTQTWTIRRRGTLSKQDSQALGSKYKFPSLYMLLSRYWSWNKTTFIDPDWGEIRLLKQNKGTNIIDEREESNKLAEQIRSPDPRWARTPGVRTEGNTLSQIWAVQCVQITDVAVKPASSATGTFKGTPSNGIMGNNISLKPFTLTFE